MKKKAKQIAKVMSNDSLEVVAQMIADEAKGRCNLNCVKACS